MIDHLVYLANDLERGCDQIEKRLGVRPVPGGRHPDWGTHNAILSIGPETYLEVIARDPDLPVPKRGVLFGDRPPPGPIVMPVTWALRCEDLEKTHSAAAAVGVELGEITPGSRERSDGTLLEWQLTHPAAMPMGGVVPFLISWGDSPHPATMSPSAGELIDIRLEHPEPERANAALTAMGCDVRVAKGRRGAFAARIETARGPVDLVGRIPLSRAERSSVKIQRERSEGIESQRARWNAVTQAQWSELAERWFHASDRAEDPNGRELGMSIALMNHSASTAVQWRFVDAALDVARTDQHLKQLAAGPIEHLLGTFGDVEIDECERRASEDPRFARLLTGTDRHGMSDEVWARVRSIQAQVDAPLLARTGPDRPESTEDGAQNP